MPVNTLTFLQAIVKRFDAAALPVWLFGGWAEELWQLIPARKHNDIDFLYFEQTFEHLDSFITRSRDIREIQEKRFSHKRAIVVQNVMIEFLLVQQGGETYFTDFFSGRYRLEWPADVFSHTLSPEPCDIKLASIEALSNYRQQRRQIEDAYQDFLVAPRKRTPVFIS